MQLEIAELPLAQAGDDELRQSYEVQIVTHSADYPSDPVLSYEVYTEQIRRPVSAPGPRRLWTARVDRQIAATATVAFPQHENRHLAVTAIRVPPQHRRQGIGSALLHATLAPARAEGRSTVEGIAKVGGDGERWALALGFEKTKERVTQDLIIADVDPARWAVPAPAGFRAGYWTGTAPGPLVAGYARARTAIRDAPAGSSSYQHPDWTVQRVRTHEAASRDRGCELHTVVAIHEASGTVAGLTEIEVRPGRNDFASQLDTAVLPEYRGHGLGRFIKAQMIRRLLADQPLMQMVGTTTDADNIHMIRVNHQLGYITANTICNIEANIETLHREIRNTR